MDIGLHTNCFYNESWEEICKTAIETGISLLDVAAGGFDSKNHCNPFLLLKENDILEKFKKTAKRY